ncbi:NAD-dependent epimerase/dehydratase family protein [Amycolatopsis sp. QT-25]|uniref:NAD-dependent epimerase/dehydratase family protein n=1 Tax=Amycolatopsis sp. QT-25 TaxID=3034022 RepID=UPI0023ED33E9|nr:NAD-dependent epimerase/dehydratase family protein [Amycolatopsis sp. QT-25]WET80409.1 NAD-dependent epimerase/dehydratase family protein [Amycolatopsis sp. QT-25]
MKKVLVLGGSRYFGREVVERLRDRGLDVTVLNRGSTPAPSGVAHLIADRDDEAALKAALGSRSFDVVLDQVCYTPVQAAIARRVLRAGRYVMTSTIEVYDQVRAETPMTEALISRSTPDFGLPWHDEDFLEAHYGEGKRQAETVFAVGDTPFASVRVAHVLGGDDFTGRLRHYVERLDAGDAVAIHAEPRPSTFVHAREIAAFLAWAVIADFTGPVNAGSRGELSVVDIARAISGEPRFRTVERDASPFSFDRYAVLDTSRAAGLGFSFSTSTDWLSEAVEAARKA